MYMSGSNDFHGRARSPAGALSGRKPSRGGGGTSLTGETQHRSVNDAKRDELLSRTASQHLPVQISAATDMTRLRRNNSNPRRILRLYSTDILGKTK